MRSSRALGQALAAAVACVADDPPPPAGESHGRLPEACVVEQFVPPMANRNRWKALERGTGFVHEETVGCIDRDAVDGTRPNVVNGRTVWRGAGAKSRGTLPSMQIALDAADRSRVRAGAMTIRRDEYQRSLSMYGNTPPAERAPPAPLTESRRGNRP